MFRYIATEELSLRAPLFACYAGFYVRAFRGSSDPENKPVNENAALEPRLPPHGRALKTRRRLCGMQ